MSRLRALASYSVSPCQCDCGMIGMYRMYLFCFTHVLLFRDIGLRLQTIEKNSTATGQCSFRAWNEQLHSTQRRGLVVDDTGPCEEYDQSGARQHNTPSL